MMRKKEEIVGGIFGDRDAAVKGAAYLPGSGAQRRAWREMRAVRMVSAGVHSFFRMSRQIAPVWELMLGCHIFVSNFIYSHEQKQILKSWLSVCS